MVRYTQEFKLQSVEKALSRGSDQTLKNIVDDLGDGCSTLQKWIRLAKANKLEKHDIITFQTFFHHPSA